MKVQLIHNPVAGVESGLQVGQEVKQDIIVDVGHTTLSSGLPSPFATSFTHIQLCISYPALCQPASGKGVEKGRLPRLPGEGRGEGNSCLPQPAGSIEKMAIFIFLDVFMSSMLRETRVVY